MNKEIMPKKSEFEVIADKTWNQLSTHFRSWLNTIGKTGQSEWEQASEDSRLELVRGYQNRKLTKYCN